MPPQHSSEQMIFLPLCMVNYLHSLYVVCFCLQTSDVLYVIVICCVVLCCSNQAIIHICVALRRVNSRKVAGPDGITD